jgi:hypothetical protein
MRWRMSKFQMLPRLRGIQEHATANSFVLEPLMHVLSLVSQAFAESKSTRVIDADTASLRECVIHGMITCESRGKGGGGRGQGG